jgi:heme-degrading monooxygenase HmoA
MIANVVSGRVKPDADGQLVRERLVPTLKQQAGFKGGYWLRQANSDEVLAVTIWENEETLRSALSNAEVKETTAQTSSMFIGGPKMTVYELLAQG